VPPVKMRVWMTWSELTNAPRITKEEFQAQLVNVKDPKSSILIACTKLSVGLGYGPDACTVPPNNVADLHIPIVFPLSLAPQVYRGAKDSVFQWAIALPRRRDGSPAAA
jgi:hypothetical protein